MKKHLGKKWSLAALVLGFGLAAPVAYAHINAGALSTSQGGQLYFAGAPGFQTGSGFMITQDETLALPYSLFYSNSGSYAGFWTTRSLTFTALATTNASGPPSPFAAATGSFLQVRLETVLSGPTGGTFGFWENGNTAAPTLSLGVGQTVTSGNLIPLSDLLLGAGNPGNDPFGHLHGRRYGADVPGDYVVGFRIVDTSNNGLGGGPIQTDSQLYLMEFLAVPEPTTAAFVAVGATALGFGLRRKRKIGLKQHQSS